jgi:hypothetical protein
MGDEARYFFPLFYYFKKDACGFSGLDLDIEIAMSES